MTQTTFDASDDRLVFYTGQSAALFTHAPITPTGGKTRYREAMAKITAFRPYGESTTSLLDETTSDLIDVKVEWRRGRSWVTHSTREYVGANEAVATLARKRLVEAIAANPDVVKKAQVEHLRAEIRLRNRQIEDHQQAITNKRNANARDLDRIETLHAAMVQHEADPVDTNE